VSDPISLTREPFGERARAHQRLAAKLMETIVFLVDKINKDLLDY